MRSEIKNKQSENYIKMFTKSDEVWKYAGKKMRRVTENEFVDGRGFQL